MTTATVETSLYGLLALLNDPATFRERLTELTKAREGAEQATSQAKAVMAELDAKRKAHDDFVNRRTNELRMAQADHDKVAKEAADRIAVGNNQMAELQKLKSTIDAQRQSFEAERSAMVLARKDIEAAKRQIAAKAQELADGRADLDRRRRKLAEAVA